MEKLTKEIYQKHAKRMHAILNETSPLLKYLGKKDFANIVEQQLNVLFSLEQKFSNEKIDNKYKSSELVKVYNKAANTKFAINVKFKLDDDADYLDSINYLITYCRNIFKVNLDDMAEGKKVNVSSPNVSFKQKTDIDDPSSAANYGAAMGMGMGEFMDPRRNPFVLGQASAQLQKEMATGKFYRFKTKPSIIPKIKIATLFFNMLTCLLLVLMAVFAFMANGLQITPEGTSDVYSLGTITDGIFFILFAGVGIFDIVVLFKSVLSKNENDKYYFSWQLILIFLIGTVMSVLLCINSVFCFSFHLADDQNPINVIGHNAWKITWWIAIGSIVATIIPIIIGGVKNPKIDASLIDKRMTEIIDSLTSGFGFSSAPVQKAEVQKPVEVKNNDKNKKDDSKPKPKKDKK